MAGTAPLRSSFAPSSSYAFKVLPSGMIAGDPLAPSAAHAAGGAGGAGVVIDSTNLSQRNYNAKGVLLFLDRGRDLGTHLHNMIGEDPSTKLLNPALTRIKGDAISKGLNINLILNGYTHGPDGIYISFSIKVMKGAAELSEQHFHISLHTKPSKPHADLVGAFHLKRDSRRVLNGHETGYKGIDQLLFRFVPGFIKRPGSHGPDEWLGGNAIADSYAENPENVFIGFKTIEDTKNMADAISLTASELKLSPTDQTNATTALQCTQTLLKYITNQFTDILIPLYNKKFITQPRTDAVRDAEAESDAAKFALVTVRRSKAPVKTAEERVKRAHEALTAAMTIKNNPDPFAHIGPLIVGQLAAKQAINSNIARVTSRRIGGEVAKAATNYVSEHINPQRLAARDARAAAAVAAATTADRAARAYRIAEASSALAAATNRRNAAAAAADAAAAAEAAAAADAAAAAEAAAAAPNAAAAAGRAPWEDFANDFIQKSALSEGYATAEARAAAQAQETLAKAQAALVLAEETHKAAQAAGGDLTPEELKAAMARHNSHGGRRTVRRSTSRKRRNTRHRQRRAN